MATSRELPQHEVVRGMDLLEAVHRQDVRAVQRLAGFWRQLPLVLRGRRPTWEVMADLGETIVVTMSTLRDQTDPVLRTFDGGRDQSPEGRLADAYAETVQELTTTSSSSVGAARAVLRYLALGADDGGIEYWLRTLRSVLLGEQPSPGPLGT